MSPSEQEYRKLSPEAIQVLKGVFGNMLTVKSNLTFNNVKSRASAPMQKALDELVEKGLIEHSKNGDADIYQPDLELDRKAINRIGWPKIKSFPISEDIT